MNWYGRLRSSAGLYALPLAIILAVIQARRELGSMDLNWPGASAMAGSAVVVIAPIFAAVAAWESGRLKRGSVENWTHTRPWYVVVLDTVALPLLFAACALTSALLSLLPEMASVPGAPDWRFIGVAALVCIAFIFLGFGAGRLLKPVYAVPACLVGTYLWLAYPISMQPLWLRHLTGNYDTACCRYDQIPDARALLGGTLVATAVAIMGAGLSIAQRHLAVKRVLTGLFCLCLASCGVLLVHDMSWEAATARSAQELICTSGTGQAKLRVCVWPEHSDDAGVIAKAATPAVNRLVDTGLQRPKSVTEGPPGENEWSFYYSGDPVSVPWAISLGLVPQDVPECQDHGGEWLTGDMVLVLAAWLSLKAGSPDDLVEKRVGSEAMGQVRQVTQRPASSQLKWFRDNMEILHACNVKPVTIQ
ncbi:DUF7224 domain-containing protein [Sphaerimonospora sp. CA-214678]|uniref:DUF7224 domain-containing protein n=1 Tax=Sphaerimonospora sp. CA-214678 TaxID=3240029 RepID=UPI003D93B160